MATDDKRDTVTSRMLIIQLIDLHGTFLIVMLSGWITAYSQNQVGDKRRNGKTF